MTEQEKLLMEQNKQLLKQVESLTEQVRFLTQKLFGRSSERTTTSTSPENQLSLFSDEELNSFNEAEISVTKSVMEPQDLQTITYNRRPAGKKADLIKDIPTVRVDCVLHEEDGQCEWCNTTLRPIGKEYIRKEVDFIPAHLRVKEIYRTAYECPGCKSDGTDTIIKAETPSPVIPKSLASASSVAWLLHQKFEMSLPFHRQEKEWQSYGLDLSRATMANWVIKATSLWLEPLFQLLHKQLI